MSRSKMLCLAVCLFLGVTSASAQDLWQYIDLNSDAFTKADMTRADVEAAITAAGSAPVDLSGKQLNRLDLSGINLAGANLLAARINGTKLVGANLKGAKLDQAWGLDADLTGADLEGASLVSAQLIRAKLDGANLSHARVASDFTQASLVGAKFEGVNMTDGVPERDSRRHPFVRIKAEDPFLRAIGHRLIAESAETGELDLIHLVGKLGGNLRRPIGTMRIDDDQFGGPSRH